MNKYIFNITLFAILVISIAYGLTSGAIPIAYGDVISVMLNTDSTIDLHKLVVLDLRLPRILGAGIVGACLGASGATMQAIFRNPLADPSIIGVGTGSALAIVIAFVWLPAIYINTYTMPLFAFFGALIVTFIIYRIGTIGGKSNTLFIILGGIAISIFVGTIMGLSSYLASDEQLRQLTVWKMGSLTGVNWDTLPVASVFTIGGIVSLISIARPLDIFALGEYECKDLGLNPQYIKRAPFY